MVTGSGTSGALSADKNIILAASDGGFENVFNQYTDEVQKGTQVDLSAISHEDPRLNLFDKLQGDSARFAKFREAQKQRELAGATTDLDKQKIERRYSEYLETEKHAIFGNSAAAERWMGFEDNADLYPNLEYRTAGDGDVRAEHAKLDGIVLPLNDSFWRSHTPPLGWGCRCELVQTDEPVNKNKEKYKGFEDTPAPKGFDFNPGIDKKVFSNQAGYYTSAPGTEAKQLTTEAQAFYYDFTKKYGAGMAGKAIATNLGKVKVTKKGVKAAIDQPHRNYTLKNMVMENLQGLMKELEFQPLAKSDNLFYGQFSLNGKNSYVIVEKLKNNQMQFRNITDTLDL